MAERGSSDVWRWRNESATGRVFQAEDAGPILAMAGQSNGFGRGPIYNYGSNYGPLTARGTFRSGGNQYDNILRDEDLVADAGGGGGNLGTLRGIRAFLGGQGLRGIGRYVGAFGAVEGATAALNQRNQLAIALGGASSSQDVISAVVANQQNSFYAKIPFIGELGSAIRESHTGDLAYLASVGASTQAGNDTIGVRGSTLSQRLSASAGIASSFGSFAGQREAINLKAQNAIAQATLTNTGKVTDLSLAISALGDNLTPADLDKVQAFRGEINTINANTASFRLTTRALSGAEIGAVNRSEKAAIAGSEYRTAALLEQASGTAGFQEDQIHAQYVSQIFSTGDAGEKERLAKEGDAALVNLGAGFAAARSSLRFGTQSFQQGLTGNSLAAANLATYNKYGDSTFGLIHDNPQLSGVLESQRFRRLWRKLFDRCPAAFWSDDWDSGHQPIHRRPKPPQSVSFQNGGCLRNYLIRS